jgi:Na+-transporting NADH:ubiquinone oxidoreductase subunit C
MNKNSNAYTFGFSALLVVVVGFLLAAAATGLKPYQARNVKIEKMQNILGSIGVAATPEQAEQMFQQHITDQLIITHDGNVVSDAAYTAFDIDLAKELQKPVEQRQYPLFQASKNDSVFFIIPMSGKGLWGPIWGYIALNADAKVANVYGAQFDHKSETPGLGAEINTHQFQSQYIGKLMFDRDGNYTPIRAVKGGTSAEDLHRVDAISGGTITSNGVNEMIERTVQVYSPFFRKYEAGRVGEVSADEIGEAELESTEQSGGLGEAGAESETEKTQNGN